MYQVHLIRTTTLVIASVQPACDDPAEGRVCAEAEARTVVCGWPSSHLDAAGSCHGSQVPPLRSSQVTCAPTLPGKKATTGSDRYENKDSVRL